MLNKEERKAIERIEDFLTTNIIVSISNDETANSEELKAFISKNEYLAIEFIATMFLKYSKEIEVLKEDNRKKSIVIIEYQDLYEKLQDKIKAKIEEIDIEIQCCEYADDDTEEYKQDIEKEKRRLLRDKAVLQSLLEKE